MDFVQVALIFFFIASATNSYPARPLNERSTEMVWQAWLLVDDQQDANFDRNGFPKQRVSKQIFNTIPCRNNHTAESNKCISTVKPEEVKPVNINSSNHLDFLAMQAGAQFQDEDFYEEKQEEGPIHVDIPLGSEGVKASVRFEEDGNVDVVVVPGNKVEVVEEDADDVKSSFKRTGDVETTTVVAKDEAVTTEVEDDNTYETPTMTTFTPEKTEPATPTTTSEPDETFTQTELAQTDPTTTTLPETTIETQTETEQAIFFLDPTAAPDAHPEPSSDHETADERRSAVVRFPTDEPTGMVLPDRRQGVRFRDDERWYWLPQPPRGDRGGGSEPWVPSSWRPSTSQKRNVLRFPSRNLRFGVDGGFYTDGPSRESYFFGGGRHRRRNR